MKFPKTRQAGGGLTGELARMDREWLMSRDRDSSVVEKVVIVGVYIESVRHRYFYRGLPQAPLFQGSRPRLPAERYEEYLQSDEWKEKRFIALCVAGNRCQVCNYHAGLQVHHRTYERLGFELASDLVVLCEACHEIFHKHGKIARA